MSFVASLEEHHRVALTWKAAPSDAEHNHHVKLVGYEVSRQTTPGGPFVAISKKIGPDETRFVDDTVPAHAIVTYRVDEKAELDTDDPSLPRGMPALAPEVALQSVASTPIATPRDFAIALETGTPADPLANGDAALPRATLRVYCWHGPGKFLPKSYRGVQAERAIGSVDPSYAIDRTHAERVDFTTGAILKDVRLEKRKLPRSGIEVTRAVATIEWPGGETQELVEGEIPDLK